MEFHVGVDWASGSWVVVEATTETTNISAESSLLTVVSALADSFDDLREAAHYNEDEKTIINRIDSALEREL
jgi:hypothetical protein